MTEQSKCFDLLQKSRVSLGPRKIGLTPPLYIVVLLTASSRNVCFRFRFICFAFWFRMFVLFAQIMGVLYIHLIWVTDNKILKFDPLEAVKHSKGESMDYIAQFRVMNPHQ